MASVNWEKRKLHLASRPPAAGCPVLCPARWSWGAEHGVCIYRSSQTSVENWVRQWPWSPLDRGSSGEVLPSRPSAQTALCTPSGRLLWTGSCQPGLITLFYGKLYSSTWPGRTLGVAPAREVVCPSTVGSGHVKAGAGDTAWREKQNLRPCSSHSSPERVTTVDEHARSWEMEL